QQFSWSAGTNVSNGGGPSPRSRELKSTLRSDTRLPSASSPPPSTSSLTNPRILRNPVNDSPSRCKVVGSPTGVRFGFRRLTFPAEVWRAMAIVLSQHFLSKPSCSVKKKPGVDMSRHYGGVGDAIRPKPVFLERENRTKCGQPVGRGATVAGTTPKKANGHWSSPNLAPTRSAITASNKRWDFEIELLVPSGLVSERAAADPSFHPLDEDETLWCQRIALSRGVTKQVATPAPPGSAIDDHQPEVLLVPQHKPGTTRFPEPLVLAPQPSSTPTALPVRLRLFCRPELESCDSVAVRASKSLLIGTIDLEYTALLSALYQLPYSSPKSTSSRSPNPVPKTLRVRVDFVPTIQKGLFKELPTAFVESLLQRCFGFINVEPVWKTLSSSSSTSLHPGKVERFNLNEDEVPIREERHAHVAIDLPRSVTRRSFPPHPGPAGQSLRLDVLLNVREARHLSLPQSTQSEGCVKHSYIVVRTPWCNEDTSSEVAIAAKPKRFQSAVAWSSGSSPLYHFGLRTSAVFSEELLTRLLKTFIAIEVWARRTDSGNEKDVLIGLAKVMTSRLTETYQLQRDPSAPVSTQTAAVRALLTSHLPPVEEEAWLQVVSPSTGKVCGSLQTRVAVGTANQISALIDADAKTAASSGVDWRSIDFVRWPPCVSGGGAGGGGRCCSQALSSTPCSCNTEADLESLNGDVVIVSVKHSLDIGLCSLTGFVPGLAATLQKEFGGGTFPSNDCDCFIQYTIHRNWQFPSIIRSPLRSLRPLSQVRSGRHQGEIGTDKEGEGEEGFSAENCRWNVRPLSVSVSGGGGAGREGEGGGGGGGGGEEREESFWHETHSHTFALQATNKERLLGDAQRLGSRAFLAWLGQDGHDDGGIPFELWLRVYSPRLRDVLVARGNLQWTTLAHKLMPASLNALPGSSPGGLEGDWCWCLSRYQLPLFDVTSGQLSAHSRLNLSYRLQCSVRRPSELGDFRGGCVCDGRQDARLVSTSNTPKPSHAPILSPSTAHTGVHLHVDLHSLTGLGAAASCNGTSTHLRMHCLLLLPAECPDHAPLPRLLATSVSKSLPNPPHANHLDTRLDVLLPLSWVYTTAGGHSNKTDFAKARISGPGEEKSKLAFSLAETLIHGQSEVVNRFAWVSGCVKRPCLVVQVDVWEERRNLSSVGDVESDALSSQVGVHCLWNMDYKRRGSDLHPGESYHLIASCRVPLAEMVLAGVFAPRWVALLRPPTPPAFTGPHQRSPLPSYRLGGAIEISAAFASPTARLRVLNEVLSLPSHLPLETLRSFGVYLPCDRSGGLAASPWEDGLDEARCGYKQISLRFSAARLPTEQSLLKDAELVDYRQRGLRGFFVARTTFFGDNIQVTCPHPLPRETKTTAALSIGTTKSFNDASCVLFSDELKFCAPVGPHLRSYLSKTVLEVQLWAQWMSTTSPSDSPPSNTSSAATSNVVQPSRPSSSDPTGSPAPRFLGSFHLPIFRLLCKDTSCRREFVCTPEAFYWASSANDSPGQAVVYPLFQQSVINLRDLWVAATLEMTSLQTPEALPEPKEPSRVIAGASKSAKQQFLLSWLPVSRVDSERTNHRQLGPLRVESKSVQGECVRSSDFFPAYVVIERANRLVPSDALGVDPCFLLSSPQSLSQVGTFATFIVPSADYCFGAVGEGSQLLHGRDDDEGPERLPGRVAVTPLSDDPTSPVWEYQRFAYLPISLTSSPKGLAVDVWQKHTNAEQPRHLGTAKVNLSSLILPPRSADCGGLEYVHGWYEILDSYGTSRGQILVGVFPIAPGEEDGSGRRLCPRLERLLNPCRTPLQSQVLSPTKPILLLSSSTNREEVDMECTTTICRTPNQKNEEPLTRGPVNPALMDQNAAHGDEKAFSGELRDQPCHRTLPVVRISSRTLDGQLPSPSGPQGEATVDEGASATSVSALLITLQSQLGELDIQNARLKQKLSNNSEAPCGFPAVEINSGSHEFRRGLGSHQDKGVPRCPTSNRTASVGGMKGDRLRQPQTPHCGAILHSVGSDPSVQVGQHQQPMPVKGSLRQASNYCSVPENCAGHCGTGDNNSKVQTNSFRSSATSKWGSSVSEAEVLNKDELVEEVIVSEGDSIDDVSAFSSDGDKERGGGDEEDQSIAIFESPEPEGLEVPGSGARQDSQPPKTGIDSADGKVNLEGEESTEEEDVVLFQVDDSPELTVVNRCSKSCESVSMNGAADGEKPVRVSDKCASEPNLAMRGDTGVDSREDEGTYNLDYELSSNRHFTGVSRASRTPADPSLESVYSVAKEINEAEQRSFVSSSTSSIPSFDASGIWRQRRLNSGASSNVSQKEISPAERNQPSEGQKEGRGECSLTSSSTSDVEEYIMRVRRGMVRKNGLLVFSTTGTDSGSDVAVPEETRLLVHEEEAETITSVCSQECAPRTISAAQPDRNLLKRLQRERSLTGMECDEFDEGTAVLVNTGDDSTLESPTHSPTPSPPAFLPPTSQGTPCDQHQANPSVPHSHLQALRLARQAAEALRQKQPVLRSSQSQLAGRDLKEVLGLSCLPNVVHFQASASLILSTQDPIRQRIHANLSTMVRRTNSTTGDRIQPSKTTAAAIIKAASSASSLKEGCSPSPGGSLKLSSRSIARAARIFDMKL
uniref:Arrestin_N domain-containing protein n=1 Tax=Mesocestoides corti TaxID=53468 RepID=A0A5K3F4L0_MESCO